MAPAVRDRHTLISIHLRGRRSYAPSFLTFRAEVAVRNASAGRRDVSSKGTQSVGSRREPITLAANWVVEQLERRVLLSGGSAAAARPLFYVDAVGASDVTYRGPVTVNDLSLSAFSTPTRLGGDE